jgi:hypothetical protein
LGIKWGAAFFGWLTATGTALILTAIATAAGAALGVANTSDDAGRSPTRSQAAQIPAPRRPPGSSAPSWPS